MTARLSEFQATPCARAAWPSNTLGSQHVQTVILAQVVSFADSLKDSEGRPLVRSARIASSLPLPQEVPDIVVATPAGLMGATTDLGPYAGWEWTKAGIVSRCSRGHCAAAWLICADCTQVAVGLQTDDASHASNAVTVLG